MDTRPHTPGQPIQIDPAAWYTDADLRLILRLPGATIRRARSEGELRHTRRGMTTFHRGDWVIAWLTGEPAQLAAEVAHV